jgi:hypothetical protein
MTAIHADLAEALDAIAIESSDRYRILGAVRELGDAPRPPDSSAVLPMALSADLYGGLYTRPGRARAPAVPDFLAQRDFLSALSAANTGRGTWEPHWKIGETDEDGRTAVTKDGLTFWVPPDGLRVRGGRLEPGASCRVRVGKELRALMPGFYLAIGDGDEDDETEAEEPVIRLYWHLTADAAVPYLAAATTHLNKARVPFRTKVLSDPWAYERADAGVLYFGQRHFARVREAVGPILSAVGAGLRGTVPLFTKPLAPGLGFAEDPRNGMSFGQHRCFLIAQGLWKAFEQGEHERDARGAAIARAFREAGLDPLRPHLEPNSTTDTSLESSVEPGARRQRPRPSPTSRSRAKGRRARRR